MHQNALLLDVFCITLTFSLDVVIILLQWPYAVAPSFMQLLNW